MPAWRGSLHLVTPINSTHEPVAELLRHYSDDPNESPGVARISLAETLRLGDDPLHILPYLAGLGHAIS